jgi:small subunit ribosomal protein S15
LDTNFSRKGVKMARIYSRSKGKAGSKKPLVFTKPTWIRYSEKEINMLVLKLAKDELTPSQIGLVLRDRYGIPDIKNIIGKSVTDILKEKKMLPDIPEDLYALLKRASKIINHLEQNKQDQTAKRGRIITESKIRRLSKYYKKTGMLPKGWKYNPDQLKLIVS